MAKKKLKNAKIIVKYDEDIVERLYVSFLTIICTMLGMFAIVVSKGNFAIWILGAFFVLAVPISIIIDLFESREFYVEVNKDEKV